MDNTLNQKERKPTVQPATSVHVAMIGPVPTHWGGGAGWRGGGVASHIYGLLPALAAHDVTVSLLADNTDEASSHLLPRPSPGIEFQGMARSPLGLLRLGPARAVRLVWRMLRAPQIRTAAPPAQVLRFLGQAINFDHSLAASGPDVLHIHQAFHRQFLCQQVLGVSTPLVVTVHSVNALLQPHPDWVERMILTNYRRADWMIVVSHYVRDQIVGFGADPERITVITNGVDVETFRPGPPLAARRSLALPQDAFIVLFSGNLIARKGVDVLLQAFGRCARRYPTAHLAIVGTGEEEDRLLHLTAEMGIASQVTFAGYKPLTEMPLWYQACDVFVMPSWAEGLAMSILEAMAVGRPVITSRPDLGEHDAVVPEETGILTDYGDVDALAQALVRLISTPKEVRSMCIQARHRAEREFRWDIIGGKTAQVYHLILERFRHHP